MVLAGKDVSEVHLVGAEQVQSEAATVREYAVLRICSVEANQKRRRIVRYRAGRRDRDAASLTLMFGGHDVHMTGQTAHGITVCQRVQLGLVQHGSLQIGISV